MSSATFISESPASRPTSRIASISRVLLISTELDRKWRSNAMSPGARILPQQAEPCIVLDGVSHLGGVRLAAKVQRRARSVRVMAPEDDEPRADPLGARAVEPGVGGAGRRHVEHDRSWWRLPHEGCADWRQRDFVSAPMRDPTDARHR